MSGQEFAVYCSYWHEWKVMHSSSRLFHWLMRKLGGIYEGLQCRHFGIERKKYRERVKWASGLWSGWLCLPGTKLMGKEKRLCICIWELGKRKVDVFRLKHKQNANSVELKEVAELIPRRLKMLVAFFCWTEVKECLFFGSQSSKMFCRNVSFNWSVKIRILYNKVNSLCFMSRHENTGKMWQECLKSDLSIMQFLERYLSQMDGKHFRLAA